MIQSIFTYIIQAVLALLLPILYVFCTACLMPKLLLKPSFTPADIKDRGLKRYLFESGRAIVCLPDPKIQTYIPQYILSDNNGERFLKCQLDPNVLSLKYRILTFDVNDRPLEVLEVSDPVRISGVTKSVPLPLRTAYVSIQLLQVNGVPFPDTRQVRLQMRNVLIYLASTVVLTICMALLLRNGLRFVADLLFAYSDTVTDKGGSGIFGALLLGSAYAGIVFMTHFFRSGKSSQ